MAICDGCGSEAADGESSCPVCKPAKPSFKKSRRRFQRLFKAIIILLAVTLCAGLVYLDSQRSVSGSRLLSTIFTPGTAGMNFPPPIVDSPTPIGKFNDSNESVSRNYNWEYQGKWSLDIKLPVALYDYYRSLPRSPTRNYSVYVTHPLDSPYIEKIASSIKTAAAGAHFNGTQAIEFASAFVQNLPYTVDNVTTGYDEYPRYPFETLVDAGGDCEDKAILLAAILSRMGDDVVLINPPNHVGLGVKVASGNVSGVYWDYAGDKYYYIETTGNNWHIGAIPDAYKNSAAFVFPLTPVPVLTHTGNFTGNNQVMQVSLEVSNLGTAAAHNVTVMVGFDGGNYVLWNAEQSNAFVLDADKRTLVKLQLKVPPHEHTRVVVQVIINGILFDESRSGWFET